MAQYVFGVEIICDRQYTEDTSIGLYTEAGISYIRLITNYVVTTLRYKEHFLIGQQPIGNVVQSADFRRSGNPANVDGTELQIDNTASFFSTLDSIVAVDGTVGLSLNGLRCKIIRFDASTSPATETVEFYGICQTPEWTETYYRVPVQSAQYKRQANLTTQIDSATYPYANQDDIGNTIPATVGMFFYTAPTVPLVDAGYTPAKLVRTSNRKDITTWGNGSLVTPQTIINTGAAAPWDILYLYSDLALTTIPAHVAATAAPNAIITYAFKIGNGQTRVWNFSSYSGGAAIDYASTDMPIYAGTYPNYTWAGRLIYLDGVHKRVKVQTFWGAITPGAILHQPYTPSLYNVSSVGGSAIIGQTVYAYNSAHVLQGTGTFVSTPPSGPGGSGTVYIETKSGYIPSSAYLQTPALPTPPTWYANVSTFYPDYPLTVYTTTVVAPSPPDYLGNLWWKGSDGNYLSTDESGTYTVLRGLIGKFVHCIDGDGKDEYRQILNAYLTLSGDQSIIGVTVAACYTKPLAYNLYGTAANQSLVRIESSSNEYTLDVWPCGGFTDSNGTPTNISGLPMTAFTYETNSNVIIPGQTITTTPTTTASQTVSVQQGDSVYVNFPERSFAYTNANYNVLSSLFQYYDSEDTVNGFIVWPLSNCRFADNSLFYLENYTTWYSPVLYRYFWGNGVWTPFPDSPNYKSVNFTTVPTAAELLNVTSCATTTTCKLEWSARQSYGITPMVANVVLFDVIPFPATFSTKIDKVFFVVGIKHEQYNAGGDVPKTITSVEVYSRPNLGGGTLEWSMSGLGTNTLSAEMADLPSFLYNPAVVTDYDSRFYQSYNVTGKLYGYINFELGGWEDIKVMNSKKSLAIFMRDEMGVTTDVRAHFRTTLGNASLVLQKKTTLKSDVYALTYGRIFNSTWGGRKDPSQPIFNCIDFLEHVLRLQDWTEVGATETPGKQYAAGALINTAATEGGFDNPLFTTHMINGNLTYYGFCNISCQLNSVEEGYTTNIIQNICRQYFLTNYQNTLGQECLNSIFALPDTSGLPTVDLYDIVGEISTVQDQDPSDVFCEPVINYNYDQGGNKFINQIAVTHSSAPTFVSSYVTGIAVSSTAQDIWERCHALYKYYRQVEIPPADLSDMKYANTSIDYAIQQLTTWLEFMGVYKLSDNTYQVYPKRRTSFDIPYEIGKDFFVSKHFMLSVPFQTGGVPVQCIVEKITRNTGVKSNLISLEIIMLKMTDVQAYWIKDTFAHYGTVGWNDWRDSFLKQAVAPSQGVDIHDII